MTLTPTRQSPTVFVASAVRRRSKRSRCRHRSEAPGRSGGCPFFSASAAFTAANLSALLSLRDGRTSTMPARCLPLWMFHYWWRGTGCSVSERALEPEKGRQLNSGGRGSLSGLKVVSLEPPTQTSAVQLVAGRRSEINVERHGLLSEFRITGVGCRAFVSGSGRLGRGAREFLHLPKRFLSRASLRPNSSDYMSRSGKMGAKG
jgi:hypothetical protein